MSLLGPKVKPIAEKATGWRRPKDPKVLLRERKAHTYRFKDDGLIPNHPRWPFVIYKSVVRLPQSLTPPPSLKSCSRATAGAICGGTAFTIGFIITPAPTRFSASPAAAPRCSSGGLRPHCYSESRRRGDPSGRHGPSVPQGQRRLPRGRSLSAQRHVRRMLLGGRPQEGADLHPENRTTAQGPGLWQGRAAAAGVAQG